MVWDKDRGRLRLELVANIMVEILDRDDAQLQEQLYSHYRHIEKFFDSLTALSLF